MTCPVVSVLIVSFNTRQLLLDCIRSLLDQSSGLDLDIVVVDNASRDGSVEAVSDAYPGVRLVPLERNVGFAAATNLAAREAKGEYVLLLNPDTVVLDRAVERAVDYIRTSADIGILGVRTLYADGSLNATCCFGVPSVWSLFCKATGLSAIFSRNAFLNSEELGGWDRGDTRDVGVITGCFSLLPKVLWDQLGGFDERFFMYSEDTDLSVRVRRAGFRCVHLGTASIIHYGGQSDSVRSEKMMRVFAARIRFFGKHHSRSAVFWARLMLQLHAWSRMVGYGIAASVSSVFNERWATWRNVWRERCLWRGGNPAVVAQAPANNGNTL